MCPVKATSGIYKQGRSSCPFIRIHSFMRIFDVLFCELTLILLVRPSNKSSQRDKKR